MNDLTSPCAPASACTQNSPCAALVRPNYRWQPGETAGTLRVFVPGVSRDAIELHFEDQTLRLRARRARQVPETWRALRRESHDADYALALQGFEDVDGAKIQARLEDGVLTLILPKRAEATPRAITIE